MRQYANTPMREWNRGTEEQGTDEGEGIMNIEQGMLNAEVGALAFLFCRHGGK
ncbi:MAG: hypothetical protein IM598_09050 [Chitinophagaceae bacterium]|nr:hypothetical protein [Chitinophagaceae bacterium]MCA6458623.1 hypothetical protein [Chitinophagaceae bacterium]MCA6464961.1 hypothetical protein [Chitinophagaceae bacterium]